MGRPEETDKALCWAVRFVLNRGAANFLDEMANVANGGNVANAAGQCSPCGQSGQCGQCSQWGQWGVPLGCGPAAAAGLFPTGARPAGGWRPWLVGRVEKNLGVGRHLSNRRW